MSEVIGNEIILSDYLTHDDFCHMKNWNCFHLLCSANPRKIEGFEDIFNGVFGDRLTKPIWQNTKHENVFSELFPFLKSQVVFGLGKGAYKNMAFLSIQLIFILKNET